MTKNIEMSGIYLDSSGNKYVVIKSTRIVNFQGQAVGGGSVSFSTKCGKELNARDDGSFVTLENCVLTKE